MAYGIIGLLGHFFGQNQTIPFISEVTMAAPDIIRVEVRDPVITKYPPFGPLGTADTGTYRTETFPRANPYEGNANWTAQVLSLTKKWLKFYDKQPTQFLDRVNARNTSNWGTIGGRTVNNIYYNAHPYDESFDSPSGAGRTLHTASQHYIYLHLSGNLAQGTYTISNAAAGLVGVSFVWNDLTTRCCSLRTGVGHRPSDLSKQAYLSLWMPGHSNEGAVDFLNDYTGLSTFHVIDSTNSVVATGTITQRMTPTATEIQTLQTVSAVTAPKLASIVTTGSPNTTITTTAPHGFVNGQVKFLRGFNNVGGVGPPNDSMSIEHQFVTIANVTSTTFTVPIVTTGQTWASGTYLSGYDGLIYDVVNRNRAATFVFNIDFSSYTTAPAGTYRIQIPGLGVSDPFLIHDGVHSRIAQNAVAGQYNMMNGIALDGRFGYTRPAPFIDGVNGVTIKWSKLPGPFGSELNGGPILASKGGIPITSGVNLNEWLTSTRATGLYGSMMDAADWDTFILPHGLASYELLDLAYEKLPTASRMTSFNFPKSSTTLDPTLYAGSDFLPDAIHQALWVADFYRRTQDTSGTAGLDGLVASGMGYDAGIGAFPSGDGGGGGGGSQTEPSHLSIDQPFLYAADEASNFTYAGLAAKIATIFLAEAATATGLGQTQRAIDMNRIASAYQTSAIAAYNWAAPIYADTGTGGVRDAYYKTLLGVDVRAGWSAPTYASEMTTIITTAGPPRTFAAGALYRLTKSNTYRSIVEPLLGNSGPYTEEGLWEYLFAFPLGGGDATYNSNQTAFLGSGGGGFQNGITNDYVNYSDGVTATSAYRMLTFRMADARTRLDNNIPQIIRAHVANRTLSGTNTDFLRILQAGQPYYYGANQLGLSLSVGLGARYPNDICHRDSQALGVTPPTGITAYGIGAGNTNICTGFFNWSIDNGSNYAIEYPATSTKQVVEPFQYTTPLFENYYQNSYMITTNEFTYHECITPRQYLAMWLHGWDNNTTT